MIRIHRIINNISSDRIGKLSSAKVVNRIFTGKEGFHFPMTESGFGYKFNSKGIPEHFKQTNYVLGTASGQLYVDPEFVSERTTKGYVSEQELANGFEVAEKHFSEKPTENEYMYDSFKFHTYDHSSNIVYCLPFGLVYYKELDHE